MPWLARVLGTKTPTAEQLMRQAEIDKENKARPVRALRSPLALAMQMRPGEAGAVCLVGSCGVWLDECGHHTST